MHFIHDSSYFDTQNRKTETILKEISSQITEIEATEKIDDINNFLDESLKKKKNKN